MPLSRFESMLKTDNVYFFDSTEFEGIVQHYLDVGKHSLAYKALSLGLEQHPYAIGLKLLQVELFVFENKIELAINLLDELESIEPNNDEIYIQRSIILSQSNKHKEAISILKRALDCTNDPADIWSLIGMEYLYLDDFENARLNFANCIEVDYEDYSSLYNILYCFEMDEQYDDAITFLKAYIDKNPYNEVAWHQLGRQHFTLKNYEKALEAFEYSTIIDEAFIGGYLETAKTLEELNRYEEAIENYTITLKLDDPTAFVYIRIGQCFEKLNNTDSAIVFYKKAVHEDPLLDKGWLLLTDTFFKTQDYQKALYYINKALKIDDTSPVYWRKLANIYLKLNDLEKASNAFYTCLSLGDIDIEIYIALADILLFSKEYQDALAILVTAKKTYNDFAEIEYRLSGLFLLLNEHESGLKHLKNGLAIDSEYHTVIKDLFPTIFDIKEVKKVINIT